VTRLIGVIHLPALPGSPRSTLPLQVCIERALDDARALQAGGVDAVLVENFNDVPFRAERVDTHTVAAMTAVCLAVRCAVDCEVGVNVLRNDASAALSIAAACDARFIRVNVHTGAMLTDQGVITGRADETLRLRRLLGVEHVRILADVLVKHAEPLGPLPLEDVVKDTLQRGLADAVIVSGRATGEAAPVDDVRRAVAAAGAPVYVGSGVTAENVGDYARLGAGVIVGTWLKRDGVVSNPVDVERVRRLRDAFDMQDK
jgi:membrane complex biogenesis BtpA family protein